MSLKTALQAVLTADDATPASSAVLAKNVGAAIADYYVESETAAATGVISALKDEAGKLEDFFGFSASAPVSTPVDTTPVATPVDTTPTDTEPVDTTPTDATDTAAAPVAGGFFGSAS